MHRRDWGKILKILLIDDDPNFCEAVVQWVKGMNKRDISASVNALSVRTTPDPVEFMSMVEQSLIAPTKTLALIDMDIEGDKSAGLSILKSIKEHQSANVSVTPAVIYSNSTDPNEVFTSYDEGANSFYWKGPSGKQKKRFADLVKHWRDVAENPIGPPMGDAS